MARVRYQGHGIAGEAKDDLKDHEGGVETNSDCEGGSEVRRGVDVSAGRVSVAGMIVVSVILMGLMRIQLGHKTQYEWTVV
jgi:hypothetical protein